MAFFGTAFRGADGLNQTEMLQAAQSQYEEGQVQGAVLNILGPGNESLTNLMTFFFETRQEKNKARVACFFEQKLSNVGAILRGSRIQVCGRKSSSAQLMWNQEICGQREFRVPRSERVDG